MDQAVKVRALQAIYAGALADIVLRLGNEGLLEKVTQQKREEQLLGGKARAEQMGMTLPEDVFIKLSELMGCADWVIAPREQGKGFTAIASRCMLCAIAKKLGAQSPCRIYCLDPMEGMVKGLERNVSFEVLSTLYEEDRCHIWIQLENQ